MGAIFRILAAIAELANKFFTRRMDKADEPGTINQKEHDENAQAVASGDINSVLDHRLNRLPDRKDKSP